MIGYRVITCGRLALRAIAAGGAEIVASRTRNSSQSFSTSPPVPDATPSSSQPQIIARCAGFPKDLVNGPSTVRDHGSYGDDACFVAKYRNTLVAGVADGVGGWRKYGIDPSAVSKKLMKECEKRVLQGKFDVKKPEVLVANSFVAAAEPPRPIGSSTACVIIVEGEELYSSNLGDSGFVVVRGGRVVARSREQTHYFNAPFQLTLPPDGFDGFIGDSPLSAEKLDLRLQRGDVIVLATDGLWDNMPEERILEQVAAITGTNVQEICNSIALTARRLAFDAKHESPFAKKALLHGIEAPGGKPDDITLVLVLIA